MILNNLIIFLYGLIIFEFLSFYPRKIFADDFKEKNQIEIEKFDQLALKRIHQNIEISNSKNFLKEKFIKDFKENGEKLFNLLAYDQEDLEEKYFVEIDSDKQYRDKNIFIAEGNAIIYLSNATLQGDQIKYDLQNKLLTVVGNIIFKKGEQFFEASKLFYDLKKDKGYINDVYGLLDNKTFENDFKLDTKNIYKEEFVQNYNEVDKPRYLNSATIGIVNEFEDDKDFNITSAEIKIPEISRWRYKTNKLSYNSKTLESEKIFFTNDIYNDPQFVFLSKNFSAEIIDQKLKLISKNSWIILDQKLKVPIGRRSFFDKDPLTKWGIGADYKDKDGYYLFRGTSPSKLFNDYSFQLQPYFLIQRAIQGNTNAFTAKNSSPLSNKVKNDVNFLDNFALDLNLKGKEKKWDIDSKIQLNSLNTERLDESLRTNLTLTKRINLKNNEETKVVDFKKDLISEKDLNSFVGIEENKDSSDFMKGKLEISSRDVYSEKGKKIFNNFLDLQLYNIFREKITKDFGTEEIYFASGFNLSNKKIWLSDNNKSNLNLIFDVGHFKSESSSAMEFKELFRNAFVAKYNYKFPIWRKSFLDKKIDKSYIFSPVVIPQSLNWSTGLQTGVFLYSDGSNQSAFKFNTGPVLTLGGLKEKFLDYTKISVNYTYVLKGGQSPFRFDNINETPRIKFNFQQQIYGPLLFGLDTTLNLDNSKFSNVNYTLDFKRRAYSLGAFYNSTNESFGIRFNIFNFDYSGLSEKF